MFLVAALKAALGRRLTTTVTGKVAVPRFSPLLLPMLGMVALTVVGLAHTVAAADRRMTVAMTLAAGTTFLMSGMLTAVTTTSADARGCASRRPLARRWPAPPSSFARSSRLERTRRSAYRG